MNKIILSLIFVFIALMGITSVSACDADNCACDVCNCTEDYIVVENDYYDICRYHENNLENIGAVGNISIDDDVGLENVSAADDTQQEFYMGSYWDWLCSHYGHNESYDFCQNHYGEYVEEGFDAGEPPEFSEEILNHLFVLNMFDGRFTVAYDLLDAFDEHDIFHYPKIYPRINLENVSADDDRNDIPINLKATHIYTEDVRYFSCSDVANGYASCTFTLQAGFDELDGEPLYVEFNGVGYNRTTWRYGDAKFSIPESTPEGNYTIKVSYAGRNGYAASSQVAQVHIFQNALNIIAPENVSYSLSEVINNIANYQIRLTPTNSVPLNSGKKTVTIEYDGVSGEYTANDLGIINYRLHAPSKGQGIYTLKISYYGTYVTPRLATMDNFKIYFNEEHHFSNIFTTNVEIYSVESFIVNDFSNHYFLSDRLPNVPELIKAVSEQYGSANVSTMASNIGVSEGMIIEAIHEIKLGIHGQKLKELFAQKDKINNDLLNVSLLGGIMELYGSYACKEIGNILNISDDLVFCILSRMYNGAYGIKYQKFILDKNAELIKQIHELESFVVDFNNLNSFAKKIEENLTIKQKLIYKLNDMKRKDFLNSEVPKQYGSANVSTMASTFGVSERIILKRECPELSHFILPPFQV